MARFTTRVELHSAKDGDYEKLHKEMEKEKFTRTITTDTTILQLPTAEYNREGELKIDEVLASAKRAADKVDSNNSILVTEALGSRTWHNLTDIKK